MSKISHRPIVWQEDEIKELSLQIAKELSGSLKRDIWYNYHLRFKIDRNGDVIISDPSAYEIEELEKFINKV